METYLFLPQMRLTMEAIVERALSAEAAGFDGLALMDHLAPPNAETHAMHEAMVTAAWVLARTSTLRVGHLVLCDAFRHPAMLSREVISLDHASGGRFDLGIGWGSVTSEFEAFGVGSTEARRRVERLAETLQVLGLLWTGEPVSFSGEFHRLDGACANPPPLGPIPIVIGGVGRRTLELVAEHAQWWNVPVHRLASLDEMRPRAGAARLSVQLMVSFVPPGGDAEAIHGLTMRRFGYNVSNGGVLMGDAEGVTEGLRAYAERGVERVYLWFSDFAAPATLDAFAPVIAAMAS